MNTKGNQRYKDTRQKIEDAFQRLLEKKSIDKITVNELCREAGVHRTTFYGHFTDVYDLMNQMQKQMYAASIDQIYISEMDGIGAALLTMFQYIYDHKYLMKSYLEDCRRKNVGVELIPELMQKNMEKNLKQMAFASEEELLYHNAFFCEGLKGMVIRWINRGCVETPREMCEILAREYDRDRWRG